MHTVTQQYFTHSEQRLKKMETKCIQICDRICEKGSSRLPHTSNLLTLMIHNFRLVTAINLKFGLQDAST